MGELTFLIGGARSGKSNFAVEMAGRQPANVVFVATAEPFDDDMRCRIEAHRADRPPWPTIEAPIELADAVSTADPDALMIIDCLTVWIGNLFADDVPVAGRNGRYADMADAIARRSGPTIVVSNEVGLGLHPESKMGREYRDELGRLNQRLAAAADRAIFLVAGRGLLLTDPLDMIT